MKVSKVIERLSAGGKKKRIGARVVQRWAADNDVAYTGEGKRKEYDFSEDDYERFKNRPKPGRPPKGE